MSAHLPEKVDLDQLRDHLQRMIVCSIFVSPPEACSEPAEIALELIERLQAAEEQRDAAWAAINRVRELHRPIDTDALQFDCAVGACEHEDECPTIERPVCKACYERSGIEYGYYPCPTIQAALLDDFSQERKHG